jgi:hypothetical protein
MKPKVTNDQTQFLRSIDSLSSHEAAKNTKTGLNKAKQKQTE